MTKKLIVVQVVNPKRKPSAISTHYFDPARFTIESAKESLTQYGYAVMSAYLES